MGKQYRSASVEVTDANTKTQLTTQGSKGTVAPIKVPAQSKILESVIIAAAVNNATLGQAHAFIRLEGDGLIGGPESLAVAGDGANKIVGGVSQMNATEEVLNLAIIPSNEVEIYAEMAGTVDPGQYSVGVTLVFA